MIYKSFNISVVARLLLVALFAAFTAIFLFHGNRLMAIPCLLGAVITTISLIYFLNGVNRKIAYFFNAVLNDDTTLHFPEKSGTKSLNALHQELNKINNHIAGIKLKHAYNERFFLEMLRSSATGLIAVDENGYVEHINEAALEFLAMPYISHIDILRQRNPEFYTHLQVIKPGQSRMVKVLYNNGLRLFSLKVAVLVFDDKKYRVYSISDIKAELEENELDSWQKLIRVMTHEIMNSVAPITSMSNTMSRILTKESKPLPATDLNEKHISDVLEGLAVIENTGKGLMKFVDNYRRLTKIPNPVFLPVNIENWLNTIRLLTAERLSNENTELQIMNKSQAVTFTGDEKMLSQVMINLINNATDALIDTEKKVIRIQVSDGADGRLKINVSDNGKGINADDIEKIFIPFYTTKENGSGIGLSLSRKIMRLHKGSLSASSVQGEMTTFTLSF